MKTAEPTKRTTIPGALAKVAPPRIGEGALITNRFLRVAAIKKAVCVHFGCEEDLMTSEDRSEPGVTYRQIAMALSRTLAPLSFEELAVSFNRKAHRTCAHACETVTTGKKAGTPFVSQAISLLGARLRKKFGL